MSSRLCQSVAALIAHARAMVVTRPRRAARERGGKSGAKRARAGSTLSEDARAGRFRRVSRGPLPRPARVVLDKAIEVFAALHLVEQRRGGAVYSECLERAGDGAHRDSQQRDGVDHAGVAHLLEAGERDHRGLAELGHVGEKKARPPRHGGTEGGSEAGELVFTGEAFREDHVGAGAAVGDGTFDRGVEPVYAAGVGGGADDEGGVGAGTGGPMVLFD